MRHVCFDGQTHSLFQDETGAVYTPQDKQLSFCRKVIWAAEQWLLLSCSKRHVCNQTTCRYLIALPCCLYAIVTGLCYDVTFHHVGCGRPPRCAQASEDLPFVCRQPRR